MFFPADKGRERNNNNRKQKKKKKAKQSSEAERATESEEKLGAFARSPRLSSLTLTFSYSLTSTCEKIIIENAFSFSDLINSVQMPYISSPDDGTQIWYELVDELKEAENGGGGTEASPSSSSSSQVGGGTCSSSSSGDEGASAAAKPATFRRKRPRLVFIMGMGATSGCWGPQVDALAKSGVRAQALLLDNRGVGKSGSPRSKKSYSTQTMARDVLACMVS